MEGAHCLEMSTIPEDLSLATGKMVNTALLIGPQATEKSIQDLLAYFPPPQSMWIH